MTDQKKLDGLLARRAEIESKRAAIREERADARHRLKTLSSLDRAALIAAGAPLPAETEGWDATADEATVERTAKEIAVRNRALELIDAEIDEVRTAIRSAELAAMEKELQTKQDELWLKYEQPSMPLRDRINQLASQLSRARGTPVAVPLTLTVNDPRR